MMYSDTCFHLSHMYWFFKLQILLCTRFYTLHNLFSFNLEHERQIESKCNVRIIINWMTVHAIYYNQISILDWKRHALKPHLWKIMKIDKFLKANVLWKTDRQKERCSHKTIYSWLKHSWLNPRQSYEAEIRWVNGKTSA